MRLEESLCLNLTPITYHQPKTDISQIFTLLMALFPIKQPFKKQISFLFIQNL